MTESPVVTNYLHHFHPLPEVSRKFIASAHDRKNPSLNNIPAFWAQGTAHKQGADLPKAAGAEMPNSPPLSPKSPNAAQGSQSKAGAGAHRKGEGLWRWEWTPGHGPRGTASRPGQESLKDCSQRWFPSVGFYLHFWALHKPPLTPMPRGSTRGVKPNLGIFAKSHWEDLY